MTNYDLANVAKVVFRDGVLQMFDSKKNQIYYENSEGFWYKREYDANGNLTYCEDSDGFWFKHEYDANGKLSYYDNSEGYKDGTPRL